MIQYHGQEMNQGFAKFGAFGPDSLSDYSRKGILCWISVNKDHITFWEHNIEKWSKRCSFNGITSQQSSQYMFRLRNILKSCVPERNLIITFTSEQFERLSDPNNLNFAKSRMVPQVSLSLT